MKLSSVLLLYGLFLLVPACNSNKEYEAGKNDWMDLQAQFDSVKIQATGSLDTLVQMRNQISVQGRALTEEEMKFIEEVYRLEAELQALSWEASMPEELEVFDSLLAIQEARVDSLEQMQQQIQQLLSSDQGN